MSAASNLDSSVALLEAAAGRAGVRLFHHEDLDGFAEAYAALGRGSMTPVITGPPQPAVGWWCEFRNAEGTLVGLQGARLLGELEVDLRGYLVARLGDFLPLEEGMDPSCSTVVSQAAAELGGRTVYHSSFYLEPEVRGRGLAALLFRHAHLMAWQRWQPDLFFGIAIPSSRTPKFAARMGYSGFESDAFIWRTADPDGPVVQEGLVWAGPARMRELARDPLEGLPAHYSDLIEQGQRPVAIDLGDNRKARRRG